MGWLNQKTLKDIFMEEIIIKNSDMMNNMKEKIKKMNFIKKWKKKVRKTQRMQSKIKIFETFQNFSTIT